MALAGCSAGPEWTTPPCCPPQPLAPAQAVVAPRPRSPPMPTRSSFPSAIPNARGSRWSTWSTTTSASSTKSRCGLSATRSPKARSRRWLKSARRSSNRGGTTRSIRSSGSRTRCRRCVAGRWCGWFRRRAATGSRCRCSRSWRTRRPEQATAGAATFRYDDTFTRIVNPVGGQPITQGWIAQGRDTSLEQYIIGDLLSRSGQRPAASCAVVP